tara:strand:- start:17717 stop:20179 length:2463 start_codon:yes stop_codon:yes gene_type:complete
VWKWDWEEGLTEALATFEIAADLLEEDSDFIFNHNESILYEWVLEYRPDLFRRIQKLVSAGRWNIAGGWYLQPDCNLSDGESLVRHILIGRDFFRKHFQVEPELAYNFDAFGHNGNLPQILKKSGYKGYVHFRPDAKALELPSDLYQWEGIDGSRVAVYRPPFTWYGTDDHEDLRQRIEDSLAGKTTDCGMVGVFWGMGDHGGGATRKDLEVIRSLQGSHDLIRQSSTNDLLEEMEGLKPEAPVWKGDLQRVFTGCYTSVAQAKQGNRRSESLVQMAERYAALAWWFLDCPYPFEKLRQVWKDVLFNQFHDILPGSSTRTAMQGSYEIAGRGMKLAREIALEAQMALLAKTESREPLCVVVFNPHPHEVCSQVEVEYMAAHRPILTRFVTARVTDDSGQNVLCQDEVAEAKATKFDWRKKVVFEATLPAMGHAEYQIHLDTREPGQLPPPVVQPPLNFSWENEQVRFEIDRNTGFVLEFAKVPAGQNILKSPGGRLGVFRDTGDAWGSDISEYDEQVGEFRLATPAEAAELSGQLDLAEIDPVRIVEEGDVRTIVECLFVYKRSTAAIRYIIQSGRAEVEAEVRVIWNQPGLQIKWIWPTRFEGSDYLAEIPYGDITRMQNEGEHTHLRWLALREKFGEAFGIGGIGPSGHDVRNGEVRVTLLRSAIYCHGYLHQLRAPVFHDFMDLGESRFRFVLKLSEAAEVRRDMSRVIEEFALPPTALVHLPIGACSRGGVDASRPLIAVEGEGLELGALKRSEDGEDLILRIVERAGRVGCGQLVIQGANREYSLQFDPYEIKTLRLSRDGRLCENDLLERALEP